ncbi:MAG: PAS domain-containing protein, partial [Firmicutes bacterium]|nr:PAS domain-containing protein [Bacillota bacterium]
MEKEQLYLNIINNLRDGIYYVDKTRRITFWNKAAENIT